MPAIKSAMKIPEFVVFAKLLTIGFIGAEVWRAAFYLGSIYATKVSDEALCVRAGLVIAGTLLCCTYAINREAHVVVKRMARSFRLDLLFVIGIGIWANGLASPWLATPHKELATNVDPQWALVVLLLLCLMLFSPLAQQYWPRRKGEKPQVYFIADEEIGHEKDDFLASDEQAKSFAETVLASGAHAGLVFGVDGPWGVGKTSFINLAERYWERAEDKVIVCRFEPLRYASEPDLADRLIRDLSAAIQRKVFAPEFRPAASRYSRVIKGKADVSFLGFKLSLEPSPETVDDLLDDIDEVLRRIQHRVIIVIDDLDRLDAKTTNNVLFATRRTFKLSRATYILCYDTEILAAGQEDGLRAREFLEKFVTIKLSLFVDSASIQSFLQRDWQRAENQVVSIPSDTMLKLGAVLNELANILGGDLAAKYLPLVGDLRKVKRLINSMLLMQLDRSNLGRTDFNKGDLINLLLLHLSYPGLFRHIYAEETEGRSGAFSMQRDYAENEFKNSVEFAELVEEQQGSAKFLLTQLFDVKTLGLNDQSDVNEATLASRACFNLGSSRNLEGYLKLIVRFATPEPQDTFVLYQEAVDRVRKGTSTASILTSPDFQSERWEHAHDQFWRVLVNQSYDLTKTVAEDVINTLVNYLPRYSAIGDEDRGLRPRSIYSLLRLLDRAGWGRTSKRRLPNTPENVLEIAWRIFGEHAHHGNGIIQQLAHSDRGVLGWNDLMLFRLQCSADRGGQLHNLHSALIVHQDANAKTSGLVSSLALLGMRKLSQEVFSLFKQTYIDTQRNFFAEVSNTPDEAFLGEISSQIGDQANHGSTPQAHYISSARALLTGFVIHQLSNSQPPAGAGVGCGHYDESGIGDGGGIALLMNKYVFETCFNPDLNPENALHFLNYCLSNLSNSFFTGGDEEGYFATKEGLSKSFDPKEMARYWSQHREYIRQRALCEERNVVTSSYTASYSEDLNGVFSVLDELAKEHTAAGNEPI